MDLAASIQKVTEEVLLRKMRYAHRRFGGKQLCLAGGVALNCVANRRLLEEGPFQEIFVQPASGDAGGALGVALLMWHQLLGKPRQPKRPDLQSGSFLGPAVTGQEVERLLKTSGALATRFDAEPVLCDHVAGLLEQGLVVAWAQGRMEFGPRALGARSILADARRIEMQSVMNLKIKFRESFRPFAPAVLRRRVHEYFETRPEEDAPYMTTIAPVHPSRWRVLDGEARKVKGIDLLKFERSEIPAVTHVDYTARIQTVDEERHGRFYRLMEAFERRTGCPVLINTSFNVRGEPIVCTAQDAYRCFMATNIDVLVIDDYLFMKSEQPRAQPQAAREHLKRFELD